MKLLFLLAVALQCVLAQDTYTDKFDSLDLDQVLSNKRLMVAYVKCMLNKGKCTAEGRELKFNGGHVLNRIRLARSAYEFSAHITEALQNGCAKCTNAQREGMRKVIKHLITYEPDYWGELVQKYDPKKVYTQKYEKELSSI